MEHFTTYYRKLTRSEPIQCTNSGETYSGILKPDAIIAEPFGLPILKVVYAITCNTIPVLSWIAVSAASTLRLYGPEGWAMLVPKHFRNPTDGLGKGGRPR